MKYIFFFFSFLLLNIVFFPTNTVHATGDSYTVQGPSSTYAQNGVALPITDVQITQFAGDVSSTVPVNLLVSNGTIALGDSSGITFTGSTSGTLIQFEGTLSNVNAALRTLTYTRAATGTDTLEVSLVAPGEVFFEENGHLYEFISGNITWSSARTAAEGRSQYGASGYLTTITSGAENSFVAARLQGDGWMGASDAGTEGDWQWVTGPENGTSFWSGAAGGSVVSSRYANWNSGEPNDSGGNEDCAQFYVSTGRWNDLPCTGLTLSGYVVEYGAPGDMPSVASRNITITTVNPPTLSSHVPADNAVQVTTSPHLILTFDTPVVTSSGSIELRRSSDDVVIETFTASSTQITGNSTTTITILPTVTLEEQTSYYITIDAGVFTTTSSIAYAGLMGSTTWNFTTGDFTAPTFTTVTSTVTSNTAAIIWTTNEPASTRVWSGLTPTSYTSSTNEINTGTPTTSHSITLSPLLPCATYYYAVYSADSEANSATSTQYQFTTEGCEGDARVYAVTSTGMVVDDGGTSSLTSNSNTLTVTAPGNITTSSGSVVIQIHSLPRNTVYESTDMPSGREQAVGDTVFDIKAIINGTTELDSFDIPVTISFIYPDSAVQTIDETTLHLYHYTNDTWAALEDCNVQSTINSITCTTESFSIFGLFGNEIQEASSSAEQADGFIYPQKTLLFAPAGTMQINHGELITNSNKVPITFAMNHARWMALSEDPTFANVGYKPFTTHTVFSLSPNEGEKIIFAKFLSADGQTLNLQGRVKLHVQQDMSTSSPVSNTLHVSTTCISDIHTLTPIKVGYNNNPQHVRLLETFLNTYENANLPVNGMYEPADIAAVIAWQEKYAEDILAPWGITQGTGYVYITSLEKIKEIHNANCTTSEPTTPSTPTSTVHAVTQCLATDETLQFGMNNNDVMKAQQLLKKLGYFPVDISTTGYFGPITQSAIIDFQTANGIEQVGWIGPQTRANLNKLGC